MNPAMNIEAHQNRVGPETEGTCTPLYFDSETILCKCLYMYMYVRMYNHVYIIFGVFYSSESIIIIFCFTFTDFYNDDFFESLDGVCILLVIYCSLY